MEGDVMLSCDRELFRALASEPPGVRAMLQEALASLAPAYKGLTGVMLDQNFQG